MDPEEVLVSRHVTAEENLRNIKLKISLLPDNDKAMIAGLANQMCDLMDMAGPYGMLMLMFVSGGFAVAFADAEAEINAGKAAALPESEEFVTRARAGLIDGVTLEGNTIVIDAAATVVEAEMPDAGNKTPPPVFYVDGKGATQ